MDMPESYLKTAEKLEKFEEIKHNTLEKLQDTYNNIFGEKHCNYDCCVEEGQLAKLMDIIEKK